MEGVLAAEKQYQDIAEKRNINYPHIEAALAIVQKFIRERQRLLYGGMAIDLNLKSEGQPGIYAESAIPDYDIMSPDFYQDSLDLADLLHKAGMPGVSAINALHITGRRVRVNFVSVCDMSYIPPHIYAQIPYRTIQIAKYKGLRVVSPDFQRLDLHRAFSHPYENAPQEVIRQRFSKDQKRFKLLDAQFPLTLKTGGIREAKADESKLPVSLTWRELEGQAITGFLAYAFFRRYLELLLAAPTVKLVRLDEMKELFAKVPRHDLKISKALELSWNLPMRARVSLLTTDLEAVNKLSAGHTKRYYNRYLDNLRPRAVRFFWYETTAHPELTAREGDTYEASHLVRATVRSFRDLNAQFNLKNARAINAMLEEAEQGLNGKEGAREEKERELNDQREWKGNDQREWKGNDQREWTTKLDFETILAWRARLRELWEGALEDLELASPTAQRTQTLLKALEGVKAPEPKMPKGVPELEILDTFGSLVPVYSLRESFQMLGELCKLPQEFLANLKSWPDKAWIAQPQYLMMHFLANAYERPRHAHVYREYYLATMRMVQIAELLAQSLFPEPPREPAAWALYSQIPFFLGTRTLGGLNANYNLGHVTAMREKILAIQGLPSLMAQLRPPFGYYPERGKARVPFDPSGSPLFQLDGKRCSESEFDNLAMKIVVPQVLGEDTQKQEKVKAD